MLGASSVKAPPSLLAPLGLSNRCGVKPLWKFNAANCFHSFRVEWSGWNTKFWVRWTDLKSWRPTFELAALLCQNPRCWFVLLIERECARDQRLSHGGSLAEGSPHWAVHLSERLPSRLGAWCLVPDRLLPKQGTSVSGLNKSAAAA